MTNSLTSLLQVTWSTKRCSSCCSLPALSCSACFTAASCLDSTSCNSAASAHMPAVPWQYLIPDSICARYRCLGGQPWPEGTADAAATHCPEPCCLQRSMLVLCKVRRWSIFAWHCSLAEAWCKPNLRAGVWQPHLQLGLVVVLGTVQLGLRLIADP